jgi:hypothetical protein
MRTLGKNFILAVILLGVPVVVLGQGMAHSMAASHPVVTSRPALPKSATHVRATPRPINATFPPGAMPPFSNGNNAFLNGFPLDNLLGNNVPGLGFDYEHLNALSPNLGVEALIDPATQAQLALALRLLRASPRTGFGGGVWALPEPYEDYGPPAESAEPEPPAQQQPQVIVIQAPAAQAAPASVAVASEPAPAPVPDEASEFILVKRDGTQITAGAFFHQGNELVYITPTGARRTMPFGDLNVDATVIANQERGTDLQLPL